MVYLQKGTPYIYQGQEIGMTNIRMDTLDDYDDVEVHAAYKDFVLTLKDITHEDFMKACFKEARDINRIPFQWDDSINAGFNKGAKPWLKINNDYKEVNAKVEENDPKSILSFYKELIRLRKNLLYKDTFVYGKFIAKDEDKQDIFLFKREYNNQSIIVLVNMKDKEIAFNLPHSINKVLLKNYDKEYNNTNITLSPYEVIVYLE
jgi:glycosidase